MNTLRLTFSGVLRACPECKHLCPLGAARCGHCWTSLQAPKAREKLAA
jgi:hypothetical protein